MKSCEFCGNPIIGKRRGAKYCSKDCGRKASNIRTGHCTYTTKETYVVKKCSRCGEEFSTNNPRRIYCSAKCKNTKHVFGRWKREHPNARSKEDIHKEKVERDRIRQAERERYIEEMNRRKAEREEQKRANIEFWQNYNAVHVCEICGNDFEAHYPTTKYCSDKCKNKANKRKNRYKTITVDRGINLYKLARRDANICQLCGLQVNWNDYSVKDSTVVCGNMYPSIDHIKPISLGGLHSWDNVQLTHRICNTRKNNRFIG